MEKIDNSAEEEAVKGEAREFMSGIVASEAETGVATTATAEGANRVKAWKSTYAAHAKDDGETLMEQFWSIYDANSTSIWTMVYDEADSNESLQQTIEFVASFLKDDGMQSIKDQCFGVVHTLDTLEMEGLWFFNGPDPTQLFGANEDSSWYTWSQLGPEATDLVKKAVANILVPKFKTLSGKEIKDTQVFC
uniref:EF-1-gamma C-terminal domain-containing protein n=1 Tax=Odontella aurita TaxID=265563 RepID=A0A7S4HR35_9STRA|mmetsp:Transcript_13931/g.40761  ORF Transcript_13931/g.40761 Transcript_13931/m.40761 type:complete len:192 (+) Transcript_13931:248-823(+)|eukprot:CAMPEP_0113528134 /NCGR_PEP_ID=MMETSP0015_2-20120614/1672_1 /TAXON_ID=2838 /ORGANISM="Odontella" /LENGTH=191 /DNA_ID=CAMNT_0000426625 /DNA_START=131 /DNA_END=706 /DNA_ORIENTATION=+ /assembly_acc=CAM_ASM_000160